MAKIITRACAGLGLLVFATSAPAECAWLLCNEITDAQDRLR